MEVDLHYILANIRSSEGSFHFGVEKGVKGDVVLDEVVLDLPVALLLLSKTL